MTRLANQVERFVTLLESVTPFAHVDRAPFTDRYRRAAWRDLDRERDEKAWRRFALRLNEIGPEDVAGLDWTSQSAVLELAVLYPLRHRAELADTYFAAETKQIRNLFEAEARSAETNARFLAYEQSSLLPLDDERLRFDHRFTLIVDEPTA